MKKIRIGGGWLGEWCKAVAAWKLVFCVVCLFFVLPTAVRAENGRDFAGQYTLSDVIKSNGSVNAMLTVRIVNYSGHDIQGARVVLAGLGTVIADNVGLANHASQAIRIAVTISSRDFAHWRSGPPLTVEYREIDGTLSRRAVELIRTAAIEEVR